ncbi:hypothetical protein [Allosphingosinicella vermicomposti]|uniref:hypothetical protein n=1 Tax=Allosphingosinicella vermicomposti TaxID=614671 RepID=UPI001FE0FA9C|nr:hypothetical protein [Allosphingosinicella vermicomposti]
MASLLKQLGMAASIAGGALGLSPVSASETTAYKYDALGRLVQTNVSGGANNGLANQISYDPAGNRENYQTTGAKPRTRKVIVLPLNGYTIIPLP